MWVSYTRFNFYSSSSNDILEWFILVYLKVKKTRRRGDSLEGCDICSAVWDDLLARHAGCLLLEYPNTQYASKDCDTKVIQGIICMEMQVLIHDDGTLVGVPCRGLQPPWHAKYRFSGFRNRVGLLGVVRKTDHILFNSLRKMAEILPIWNGVKPQTINQSMMACSQKVLSINNIHFHSYTMWI